jgi:hypothetical protein
MSHEGSGVVGGNNCRIEEGALAIDRGGVE